MRDCARARTRPALVLCRLSIAHVFRRTIGSRGGKPTVGRDEASAREWFESHVWPNGRHCPRRGSTRTTESKHKKTPYRCSDCRSHFSAETGTAPESSKIPLRKRVFAIYLEATGLKGVSSMKLHRDLKVTQKTA